MKHQSRDTVRFPKPRQNKTRSTGRVRTKNLPVGKSAVQPLRHVALFGNTKADYDHCENEGAGNERLPCHPKDARGLGYCPSLDKVSRETEVGLEPCTFRSVNSPSNR
ncbi:hypothetical protein T265_11434 [Opisthorchis viverrini]|uniref:Uncharacterized protein n=1 Tax=Opisthorchis viverrini TaxID=6198 RepID=A0A074Z9G9_OPIVI|nr:hypothetical protein T265_11434 [Opisthorchis viverrini]KER19895.1 hypothetical protein T265_11434 [Opisthorchis viverrini]